MASGYIKLPVTGGGFENPMTTLGDVIYGGVAGTPERLGIGTEDQVLAVSAGGIPEWVDAASGNLVCASSGDTNANIAASTNYHAVTALTATRTLTLPAVSGIDDGHPLTVKDESGDAGTYPIVVDGNGAETIDGEANISVSADYGCLRLVKRGSGWWSI